MNPHQIKSNQINIQVYTTVCNEREPTPVDFTPLRVDWFARYRYVRTCREINILHDRYRITNRYRIIENIAYCFCLFLLFSIYTLHLKLDHFYLFYIFRILCFFYSDSNRPQCTITNIYLPTCQIIRIKFSY